MAIKHAVILGLVLAGCAMARPLQAPAAPMAAAPMAAAPMAAANAANAAMKAAGGAMAAGPMAAAAPAGQAPSVPLSSVLDGRAIHVDSPDGFFIDITPEARFENTIFDTRSAAQKKAATPYVVPDPYVLTITNRPIEAGAAGSSITFQGPGMNNPVPAAAKAAAPAAPVAAAPKPEEPSSDSEGSSAEDYKPEFDQAATGDFTR